MGINSTRARGPDLKKLWDSPQFEDIRKTAYAGLKKQIFNFPEKLQAK